MRKVIVYGVTASIGALIWVPLLFGTVHGPRSWEDRVWFIGWVLLFLVNGFVLGTAFGPNAMHWARGRERGTD